MPVLLLTLLPTPISSEAEPAMPPTLGPQSASPVLEVTSSIGGAAVVVAGWEGAAACGGGSGASTAAGVTATKTGLQRDATSSCGGA